MKFFNKSRTESEAPAEVAIDNLDEEGARDDGKPVAFDTTAPGASGIEAAQALWGKTGRWLIIIGLAMMMITYELDNSTVYVYNNYSTSSFNALSKLATLSTASTIVFAVVKAPIAKVSNVIGRGQTYVFTVSCYVLAYILMASAKSINTYAAGVVFYSIGQSGTNTMNDVIISDITTARWRGFGIGVSFFPFLITPWVAAFIVESVVDGIGWRWGIGMFAILMPFGASFLITTLLYYQARTKKMGLVVSKRPTVYEFCSQIDLGGIVLFSGGLAMLLLPLTLAATSPSRWNTPYIIALIVVGALFLIALPFYEAFVAENPIVPPSYFKNVTISLCMLLIALDAAGFSCTHTYLFTWATVARNFGTRDATFFIYTNGVTQTLMGIVAGLIMAWTRKYKYLAIVGAVIRLVGYGVMIRLRGAENSKAELFIVQLIQGIGSGIIQMTMLIPAQISVPHAQMPQMTALLITSLIMGSSIGACISGGIYTNTLKPALWNYLGDQADETMVDSLFNSITGVVPEWGTPERTAVNLAFSDVLRYMTYAAVGTSAPGVLLTWFLPDHTLP
ncbi:siderochrome-iron transporter [Sarocladium strictum]